MHLLSLGISFCIQSLPPVVQTTLQPQFWFHDCHRSFGLQNVPLGKGISDSHWMQGQGCTEDDLKLPTWSFWVVLWFEAMFEDKRYHEASNKKSSWQHAPTFVLNCRLSCFKVWQCETALIVLPGRHEVKQEHMPSLIFWDSELTQAL